MAILHRIFLKGPWEYEVFRNSDYQASLNRSSLKRNPRIHMPATWFDVKKKVTELGKVDSPAVSDCRFARTFHRPTGLSTEEQVWLVVTGLTFHGEILLNGTLLGVISSEKPDGDFEITSLLRPRNQLELRIASVDISEYENDRTVWDTVSLEMRSAD